jgi:hypothetical protein
VNHSRKKSGKSDSSSGWRRPFPAALPNQPRLILPSNEDHRSVRKYAAEQGIAEEEALKS